MNSNTSDGPNLGPSWKVEVIPVLSRLARKPNLVTHNRK